MKIQFNTKHVPKFTCFSLQEDVYSKMHTNNKNSSGKLGKVIQHIGSVSFYNPPSSDISTYLQHLCLMTDINSKLKSNDKLMILGNLNFASWATGGGLRLFYANFVSSIYLPSYSPSFLIYAYIRYTISIMSMRIY